MLAVCTVAVTMDGAEAGGEFRFPSLGVRSGF